MSINYTTPKPTEEGWYLLVVDGKHEVAQCYHIGSDGEPRWLIAGSDYDCWTFFSGAYDIGVVCKLDLDKIAEDARAAE